MKMQHHLAALLFATTLFAACTKEDEAVTNTATDCKPSKVYFYGGADNATITDTLVYTYTGTNVAKIVAAEGYYSTFEYSGGRITRRNHFDNLTAASNEYDTVTYNSDGTVAKIESYGHQSALGTEFKDRYEFTYSAGKLTKFTYTSYWDGVASGYQDRHFYAYTGSNITRDSVVESDPYGTDRSSVYYYTYDTQKNHFNKSGANALFHSAITMDLEGYMLPLFFSANNVIGFREAPDDEVADLSYTTDASGNLTLMKVFGIPDIAWEYQCP